MKPSRIPLYVQLISAIFALFFSPSVAQETSFAEEAYVRSSMVLPGHPRLIFQRGDEAKISEMIQKDSVWQSVHAILLSESDSIVTKPLSKRVLTGRRLLPVSRESFRRIVFCSYAYRMTQERKYLQYAKAEMLNVCQFADWHPGHFLDVAEMTAAVALGYDWLYEELNEKERGLIRRAIIQKGLRPSLNVQYNKSFNQQKTNWNQVCHASMLLGALAVWEQEPRLAVEIVNRSISNIRHSMQNYAPDGAYPEGPGYWYYGTSYNVLEIAALETIFGTDYGLSESEGFLKTGEYYLQVYSPSLNCFNYSDNSNVQHFVPAAFWFYRKTGREELLYNQIRIYKKKKDGVVRSDRFAPFLMLFGEGARFDHPKKPTQNVWTANGVNPIAIMRNGWEDSKAGCVNVKLGTAIVGHGHMDVGSFQYERDGVRWAEDLGAENYNKIEKQGVRMWKMGQESDRWNLYKYGNLQHNTLTFNGSKQWVRGKAEISEVVDTDTLKSVVSDLTPVYEGQVRRVVRRVTLKGNGDCQTEDSVRNESRPTVMTWTMMTRAKVQKVDDQTLRLQEKGKSLYLHVSGVRKATWEIKPATPPTAYENQNKGFTAIHIHAMLNPNEETTMRVLLSSRTEGTRKSEKDGK